VLKDARAPFRQSLPRHGSPFAREQQAATHACREHVVAQGDAPRRKQIAAAVRLGLRGVVYLAGRSG
jgi:hypothetical protein